MINHKEIGFNIKVEEETIFCVNEDNFYSDKYYFKNRTNAETFAHNLAYYFNERERRRKEWQDSKKESDYESYQDIQRDIDKIRNKRDKVL